MGRDLDLEARLLNGDSIPIDTLGFIYPLKIKQIIKMGINNYYQILSLLICGKEDIAKATDNKCLRNLDYIKEICLSNKNMGLFILEFLTLMFNESITLDKKGFFYLGKPTEKRILNDENYEKVKEIIKHQNYIKKEQIKSDKVKEFEARLEKMRKKYKKDEDITIIEVMSSVSSKHPSINLLNVGELTIYQLYDSFERLNIIDNYNFDILAKINGASDDNDSKLKHWSLRIDKNN